MGRLGDWLGLDLHSSALTERLLLYVILLVAAMFVVALVFVIVVVFLRASHVRNRRRSEELQERWHDQLLEVIGGAAAPSDFQARVRKGEELEVLGFLLTFARRLRGDEARVLAGIAAPYLGHAARTMRSRSPERRAFAVQALAAFGIEAHIEVVSDALDDGSPYVAMTAAQALARPEHSQHAPQVMQRLWRFVDWSSDYLSAMLARIGPAAASPARQILADNRQLPHARAVSADVLRRLNDWAATDVAVAALTTDGAAAAGSAPLQAAVLRLLAQVGRSEHLPAARSLIESPHAVVRAEAVRTLAALGGAAEIHAVTGALRDASPWVAHEAARGLLQLGRPDILEDVAREDTSVALVARQVLAEGAAT